MNGTDRSLLERWGRHRDAKAFAELVSQHAAMVFATSRRIVGTPDRAEDVAQECFLELARVPESVRASVPGWLHRAAVNRSLNVVKSEQRRQAREVRYVREQPDCAEPLWSEVEPRVDEAIEELPERLRLPIIRHFLQGATLDETARELGVARSTVQRRIEQGIEQVRRRLKRQGVLASVPALTGGLLGSAAEAVPIGLLDSLGKVAVAGTAGSAVPLLPAAVGLGGAIVMKKAVVVSTIVLSALVLSYVTHDKGLLRSHRDESPQRRAGATAAEPSSVAADSSNTGLGTLTASAAGQPAERDSKSTAIEGVLRDARTRQGTGGIRVVALRKQFDSVPSTSWLPAPDPGAATAQTDGDGRYRIEGLEPGEYVVAHCGSRSYQPCGSYYPPDSPYHDFVGPQLRPRVVPVEAETTVWKVDFVLVEGLRIAGVVVNGQGEPVEKAVVVGDWGRDSTGVLLGRTDIEGRFDSPHACGPCDPLYVHVKGHTDGQALVSFPFHHHMTDLRIVVRPLQELSGSVLDDRGLPLAGVKVRAEPSLAGRGPQSLSHTMSSRESQPSAANGAFSGMTLVPATYTLSARMSSSSTKLKIDDSSLEVRSDQPISPVTLVVRDVARFPGRVVDPAGRGVEGARVTYSGGRVGLPDEGSTLSRKDGSFEIVLVTGWRDHYRLSVSAARSGYVKGKVEGVNPATDEAVVVLRPVPMYEIQAVNGATGAPVPAWQVAWHGGREARFPVDPTLPFFSVDDPQGLYRTDSPTTESVVFIGRAPGYAPGWVGTDAGSVGRLQLRLKPGGRLRGTVVDGTGSPLTGAAVYLGGLPSVDDRERTAVARTGPDGTFEADQVPDEVSFVSAALDGFVSAGSPVEHGEAHIALLRGRITIEGRVTEGGKPSPGNIVRVVPDPNPHRHSPIVAQTDVKGRYVLTDVPAGSVRLTAETGGSTRFKHRELRLQPGQTTQEDFEFPVGDAAVEGTVTIDGQPAEALTVNVTLPFVPDEENRRSVGVQTDETGRYGRAELPPGDVEVWVTVQEHEWGRKTVSLKSGDTTRLNFEVPSELLKERAR